MSKILFRAKKMNINEWVEGFYLEQAVVSTGEVVDFAIQEKGKLPVEIDVSTLGQYRCDIRAFDGDWIFAKTTKTPSQVISGALSFNDMECVLEQNDESFPICSFAALDRLSIIVSGRNIHDNPELLMSGSFL